MAAGRDLGFGLRQFTINITKSDKKIKTLKHLHLSGRRLQIVLQLVWLLVVILIFCFCSFSSLTPRWLSAVINAATSSALRNTSSEHFSCTSTSSTSFSLCWASSEVADAASLDTACCDLQFTLNVVFLACVVLLCRCLTSPLTTSGSFQHFILLCWILTICFSSFYNCTVVCDFEVAVVAEVNCIKVASSFHLLCKCRGITEAVISVIGIIITITRRRL